MKKGINHDVLYRYSVFLYSMIGIFILLLCFMFLTPDNLRRAFFPVAAFAAFVWMFLGIALLIIIFKNRIKGKLRFFSLLTGFGAVSVPVFVILHNLFYALTVISENIFLLKTFLESLHVVFFLIAVVAAPLSFIIGSAGSLILLLKGDF